jgi:hypothetical protein
MKGAGYYDQHSTAQMSSMHALQDWVEHAVAHVPLPAAAQPVTVLDLGCSEGRNAIGVMATVLEQLRRRTGQPLQPIFSDLASNNFNQLFANLEKAQCAGRFPAGVFPAAVGGSFYGPLLPPGSVHLATSFNAIHWLDRLPSVAVPNHVAYRRPYPPRPGYTVSPEVTAAFREQAEQDLVRFLECRARELVPGGKLLLASPGDTNEVVMGDGMVDVLNDACLDLVAVGRLEREEYERLTLPCYPRTLEELLAPLQRADSPVRGAFTVDRAKALEVETPFVVAFRRGGDVTAYAEDYTGFLRALFEPVVQAHLKQPARKALIVERLYERIRARLMAEPQRYLWHYVLTAVLLSRR